MIIKQHAEKERAARRVREQPKRTRIEILEDIGRFATELCISVDRGAEDIGGSRSSLAILQDIGPLTDELERS